jgi:hypothetical protein
MDDLATLVEAIDRRLAGRTDRRDEAAIIELLRNAGDALLDRALTTLDLGRVLGDVDDRLLGPDHATTLLTLLTRERLSALGVEARARLVAALQRGRTPERDEAAIENILLGTSGAQLTALKNLLDSGSDHRDLQQLVHSDIDDDARRARILGHIASEAAQLDPHEVKVLSDIDDTFYANWKDRRYPKKTIYPGVRQLYRELDLGPDGSGRIGDLAFVTARPRDRPGVVERATHGALRERGLEQATVLAGSFFHLLSNESIADKKLDNFRQYAELFPEYGFVFIGDSGQGDADFGARMLELEPERVRAILIHDVVQSADDIRDSWRGRGVRLFHSYAGAACEAFELGLIGGEGLKRVASSCREELAAVTFDEPEAGTAREAELQRDLSRVAQLVG